MGSDQSYSDQDVERMGNATHTGAAMFTPFKKWRTDLADISVAGSELSYQDVKQPGYTSLKQGKDLALQWKTLTQY